MMKFGCIVVSSMVGFMSIASLYGMATTTGVDDHDDVVALQMQQSLSLDSHIDQKTHTLDLSGNPLSLEEIGQAKDSLIVKINARILCV